MSRAAAACLAFVATVLDGSATPSAVARLRVVTADGIVAWSAPVVAGERFAVSVEHSSEH